MRGKILVIAEQQRLQHLFDSIAEAGHHGVTVATGLVSAADRIEQEPPALVLVQDRLSGLSAELILRHLRSRLGDAPTQIVLASEVPDSLDVSGSDLHLLDLTQADEELGRQLERMVARLPKPETAPEALLEPDPAEKSENAAVDGTSGEEPLAAAAQTGPAAMPEIEVAAAAPGAIIPDTEEPGVAPAGRVVSRFEAELETELARQEPATDGQVQGVEPALSVDDLLTVAAHPASASASSSRRRFLVVAALLLLAVGGWFVNRPSAPPPPPVVNKPAPGVPAPVPKAVLPPAPSAAPAQIANPPLPHVVTAARAEHDPAYSRDHAGWERYLTSTLEFKLFREGGTLKALQVLDRAGEGVPAALFTAALEELAKVRDYRTESREVKGSYLVKRGRLDGGARVIIYKDRQDEVLHGFVIHFK